MTLDYILSWLRGPEPNQPDHEAFDRALNEHRETVKNLRERVDQSIQQSHGMLNGHKMNLIIEDVIDDFSSSRASIS